MASVTVSFCLDSEYDTELLDWLNSLAPGRRSGEIRRALKAWINPANPTTETVRHISELPARSEYSDQSEGKLAALF